MASFDFNKWCMQLKEATREALKKEDNDCEDALKLLTVKDGLSVRHKRDLETAPAPVSCEEFFTDACPIGGGRLFHGDWFYTNWAIDHPNLAGVHINLKQTFTVLLALCRWKYQLHDKCIVHVVHSDNCRTVSIFWL